MTEVEALSWLLLREAMFRFCDPKLVAAYRAAEAEFIRAKSVPKPRQMDEWQRGATKELLEWREHVKDAKDEWEYAFYALTVDFKARILRNEIELRGLQEQPRRELSERDIPTAWAEEFKFDPTDDMIDCYEYRFINVRARRVRQPAASEPTASAAPVAEKPISKVAGAPVSESGSVVEVALDDDLAPARPRGRQPLLPRFEEAVRALLPELQKGSCRTPNGNINWSRLADKIEKWLQRSPLKLEKLPHPRTARRLAQEAYRKLLGEKAGQ